MNVIIWFPCLALRARVCACVCVCVSCRVVSCRVVLPTCGCVFLSLLGVPVTATTTHHTPRSNELLKNTLPLLFNELEKCQKSLEGYLEQKRGKFPRFYFVSNPVLLQVLSQGSNPVSVQKYYEKIFDSIDRVVHDPDDVRSIVSMLAIKGADQEEIPFVDVVPAEGNIESWLGVMEKHMQETVKVMCETVAVDAMELTAGELVDEHCAQMTLLGLQLAWTADCTSALDRARSSKSAVSECNKKQVTVLAELGTLCLSDLPSKMARTKVETLVTIQVHQRDVFADLARLFKERKLTDSNDFEWAKQARFYWRDRGSDVHGDGALMVSVCDVDFTYSYEYLGCKERLVITPLTDRAYITLTQALGMNLGGAPAGPAGTGKTETVKDLGRALGLYVVVTNCTDQQRFSDMAKIFKGLCQAGLWGCFDEFNRIELPVLSVVAQQVLAITNARRSAARTFSFPGDTAEIKLVPSVGYFITMNPGYQGRQELPENLKALFRGVAMMVPDREIIMKVKLCSVGYTAFSDLAKKFRTLYVVCLVWWSVVCGVVVWCGVWCGVWWGYGGVVVCVECCRVCWSVVECGCVCVMCMCACVWMLAPTRIWSCMRGVWCLPVVLLLVTPPRLALPPHPCPHTGTSCARSSCPSKSTTTLGCATSCRCCAPRVKPSATTWTPTRRCCSCARCGT